MEHRGRTAITATAAALAAGVGATCFYFFVAGSREEARSPRGLVVRITEASAERGRERTLVSIACELENRTGRTVFLDHGTLQGALRNRLRFRQDGLRHEWEVVERSGNADRWGVPEIPLLKPEERNTEGQAVEMESSAVPVAIKAGK